MQKALRSLIHERFPFDLRVELELLSKRRDIYNAEKQEELMNLLRKYDVGNDIVPLGPGTNRYAFKLSGFVVKFATDNDGKIDNFKEFKMAKRLQPYVIKVYEVSENGTLMVCEYIQPFEGISEMMHYSERIKEILREMSSVYLIGDVGVTEKNYANWGTRVGTNDPVCLDFAYVYEVKSKLFECPHCNTGSMLVPSSDFTKLYCQNTSCGSEVSFESIRGRIGNEVHAHEIGDLSEEGYRLFTSGVTTELTTHQSNYLMKKKKQKKKKYYEEIVEEKTEEPDDFVVRKPLRGGSI